MIFLNPAILIGLAASLIPIIIHLFNRRKLEKIEFSSLTFLKELQRTKIKKIKLKQWILLAIRTLIIVFLVAAFARPAVNSISGAGFNSAAKTSAVFLIDDSPSMRALSGKGSFFSQVINYADIILSRFQDGDEMAFILLSQPETPHKFSSVFAARKFINSLKPGSAAQKYSESVGNAFNILRNSKNINKEIYLLSDLQFIKDTLVQPADNLENTNIAMYITDFPHSEFPNNFLSGIQLENQIFEMNKEIGITVNGYGSNSKTAVSLFINGVRSAQKRFNLNGGGKFSGKLTFTAKQGGLLELKAVSDDDEFNYDNTVYSAVIIPDKIKTCIFYENIGDIEFIRLALQPQNNKSLQIKYSNINLLNSINISDYDLIIIAGAGGKYSFTKIQDFVASGKGLIIFPSANNFASYNNLAEKFKLPIVEKLIESEKNQPLNSFGSIDFEHPIFRDIFGNKKSVSPPKFYKYLRFAPSIEGRKIISLKNGAPYLEEFRKGGKILLFNTLPKLNYSDFPLKGLFAPLLYKSIYYAASQSVKKERFVTGTIIPVNIADLSNPVIEVLGPKNYNEKIDLKDSQANVFYFKNTSVPGIYKFINDKRLIDYAVVNPDPAESAQRYFSVEDIKKLLPAGNIKFRILKYGSDPGEIITQAKFGIELWKYLLILVLILALVEMLLAGNTKNEIVNLDKI